MPEKEMNKAHPFAGYLRPDKEPLWFHIPKPLTWQEQWSLVQKSWLGCLLAVQILLDRVLPFSQQQRSPLIAYGVTNQRLLKRTNNKIVGKPLNNSRFRPRSFIREHALCLILAERYGGGAILRHTRHNTRFRSSRMPRDSLKSLS